MSSASINFNLHPIRFDHLKFLAAKNTQFSYEDPAKPVSLENERIYDIDRIRRNINGVQWPSQEDYCGEILGSKHNFEILKKCPMEPLIIYAEEKKGDWKKNGWELTQDLAEGAVCVDDNARAVLAYLYDYLYETSDNFKESFQHALHILTWLGYMITKNGAMYNCAWLRKEDFAGHSDPRQWSENAHLMLNKNETVESSNNSMLTDEKSHGIPAKPYRGHCTFSIYMNDLPFEFGKPRYESKRALEKGESSDCKQVSLSETNSTSKKFGLHNARTIWAFSIASRAINNEKKSGPHRIIDSEKSDVFSNFVDYYLDKLIHFSLEKEGQILDGDSKLKSVLAVGLVEHLFNYEKFKRKSICKSTVEPEKIRLLIDKLVSGIQKELIKDPSSVGNQRDLVGVFMKKADKDDHWTEWGQLQIYALARVFLFRRKFYNLESSQVLEKTYEILDDATFAANNFYGRTAFNYCKDDAHMQKQRVTKITQNFEKKYEAQIAYAQTSIVLGLYELAVAWRHSGRSNAFYQQNEYLILMKRVSAWFVGHNLATQNVYRGQNTGFSQKEFPYDGKGSVGDAIDIDIDANKTKKTPRLSGNHGAESTIEGLIALIFTRHAIKKHDLSPNLE